jgi:transcriptional regulator with XRE-family HTH domain
VKINPVALRTIRQLSGFSQAELARRTGISQGHISQIEAGQKHPRPRTLRLLAEHLGVPLGSLLAPAEDPLES